MMRTLAACMNLTALDILGNPRRLKQFHMDHTQVQIDQIPEYDPRGQATGRCTGFAVRVSTLLQEQESAPFDFKYYDVGRHRVARCENTTVLIDSSSGVGAIQLPDNTDWLKFDGVVGRWKFHHGVSSYERNGGSGTRTAPPIGAVEALVKCLSEVANNATLIFLFRYVSKPILALDISLVRISSIK